MKQSNDTIYVSNLKDFIDLYNSNLDTFDYRTEYLYKQIRKLKRRTFSTNIAVAGLEIMTYFLFMKWYEERKKRG